jgi:hypothetical protein
MMGARFESTVGDSWHAAPAKLSYGSHATATLVEPLRAADDLTRIPREPLIRTGDHGLKRGVRQGHTATRFKPKLRPGFARLVWLDRRDLECRRGLLRGERKANGSDQ